MRGLSRRLVGWSGAAVVAVLVAAPAAAQQGEQQQAPSPRVVTVTSFDVPYQARAKVFPFMREYVLPATQLKPKVLNFRVMLHNWGSDAGQVVMVAEYASFADIEAECGKPCDDYYAAHPEPKKGDDGYDAYVEARDLFSRFYGHHHDEIYQSFMNGAVVEGKVMGRVGPPPQEGNGGE